MSASSSTTSNPDAHDVPDNTPHDIANAAKGFAPFALPDPHGDDRDAYRQALIAAFPNASARDDRLSDWRGGHEAAAARLDKIDPQAYDKTRNYLNGKVTRLSPYIRHGVVELAVARDRGLELVSNPKRAFKYVQELAWRDYWLRVYDEIGDGVWHDREPYKT
ncbi:MAG: hypothetical protein AAF213_04915, partial [Pseudomonadota bacterium]